MSRRRRTITAIALCLVTLVTGGLGLGSRKVLCMDGDGHYAIEAAGHARHGGCHADHADGADHAHADATPARRDADAHAATVLDARHGDACSDTAIASPNVRRESVAASTSRFFQPITELPAWAIAPPPPSTTALAPMQCGDARSPGARPRAELASLRSIILLS